MKFPHKVKYNGVYYPVGADVPIEDNGGVKAPVLSSGKVDEVKEEVVKEEPQEKPDTEWAELDKKIRSRKYSENDLKVSIQELRKLAKENGLKFTNKNKSDDLREMLRAL